MFTKENHMRAFNDFLKINFEPGRRYVTVYHKNISKRFGKNWDARKNWDTWKNCCYHKIWTLYVFLWNNMFKRCRQNGKQYRTWSDCSSIDPDQTAPLHCSWSGSTLFGQTCLSKTGSLQKVAEYCKSLYFRVFFISHFCHWKFIRENLNLRCMMLSLPYHYICKYFMRMLNSRGIKFANISENKVLANNSEFTEIIHEQRHEERYI